ncbi:MAG: NlpC/P60 family protein [Patescibacteria group bacterium]
MKYFLQLILILTLFASPSVVDAQEKKILDTLVGESKKCNYVKEGLYLPFSKIDGSFPFFGTLVGECVDVKKNVGDMFVFGFKVFLGLVSIFAVVNISVAGIQYMINEKDTTKMRGAKKRLLDSVVGLIIAVSGYVILSTVNPKLTIVGFELRGTYLSDLIQRGANDTANIGVVAPGECIQGTAGCNDGTTPGTGTGGVGGTPGTGTADTAAGQKMDKAAQDLMGKTTCNVQGTENGTLACAFVVNDIVDQALGKPITGKSGNDDSYGRATAQMKTDLDASTKFYYAGSDTSQLQPGDIIISPTVGENSGHVGVYTSTGKIVSNSTSRTVVDDHHTPTSWTNYYNGTKKLSTYIYRAEAQQ